jgi:sugar phosphate isomerase/epimerase
LLTRIPSLEFCWGISPEASLRELVAAASAHGFGSVTLSPEHYERARAKGVTDADIRNLLADAGVMVGMLDPLAVAMPGAKPRTAVPETYLERLRFSEDDFFRVAHAVGADTLNLANRYCEKVPMPVVIDSIGALAERVVREGLQLVLEFNPDSSVPDLASARTIVAAVGIEKIRVMFDSWHFARVEGTLDELRELPPGFVGGVQISDRIRPAPGEVYVPMSGRLLPGEGTLPLVEMLTLIFEHSPTLRIGAEVLNSDLRGISAMNAAEFVSISFRKLMSQVWRSSTDREEWGAEP